VAHPVCQWCQNNATKTTMGSGTPKNQSSVARPNPIVDLHLCTNGHRTINACPNIRFRETELRRVTNAYLKANSFVRQIQLSTT